jgi:hypothetical protein
LNFLTTQSQTFAEHSTCGKLVAADVNSMDSRRNSRIIPDDGLLLKSAKDLTTLLVDEGQSTPTIGRRLENASPMFRLYVGTLLITCH